MQLYLFVVQSYVVEIVVSVVVVVAGPADGWIPHIATIVRDTPVDTPLKHNC